MPNPAAQLQVTSRDRVYSPFVRAPRNWYRADRYGTEFGFVTRLVDRGTNGRDLFVGGAGGVSVPVADAAFGGRPTLTLAGTSYFRASFEGGGTSPSTPADWIYMHAGSGMEVVNVFQNTSQSGVEVVCSTRSSAPGGTETGIEMYTSGTSWGAGVYNGTQAIGQWLQGGMSSAPEVQSLGFEYGGYPDVVVTRSPYAYAYAANNQALAAPNLSGNGPFTLFGTAGGTNLFSGKWVETIVFDHILSHWERVRVWEYLGKRYALANMAPYGADDMRLRPLLRTEPFSWIGGRFGFYAGINGRASGFVDHVRPSHAYMAPNVEAQQAAWANDAAFATQSVFNLNGAPYYTSNLPAAAWRFLQGDYYTAILIGAANSVAAGTRAFFGTCYSGTPGLQCYQSAAQAQSFIANAGGTVLAAGSFGTLTTAPTMLVLKGNPLSGAPYNYRHGLKRVVGRTGMHAATPSTAAPQSTLVLGALAGGALPGNFKLADFLIWDRDLLDEELYQVSQYAQHHYAMAA